MCTLEKLIAQLCPDGVEYKPLGEVCKIEKGVQLNRETLKEDGSYPVINGGINPSGFWDEYNYDAHKITVSQGGASAGYVNWMSRRFWAGAHCFVLTKPSPIILYRYLFYVVKAREHNLMQSQIGAGIPSVSTAKLSGVSVPIPPLPVQKEIVRMLDDMAGLIDALEEDLAARKKQYEWCREMLQKIVAVYGKVSLGDVILSLNTGLNPRKFFKLNTADATNYYVTIREMHDGNIEFTDSTDRINDDALKLCNHRSNLEIGDLLFSGTGTIGEMVVIENKPRNWNIKEGVYAIKPRADMLDAHYLRFILMMPKIRKAYLSKTAGGTVKSIPMAQMKRIEIPLPSLQEQREIVKTFDSFEKLCNSMTEGLPGEIALRKQQYEYYRDKLLAFKRAG